ncbi:MAG: hypothetical protein RL385_4873 [Pseudomonadota bacterium]
MLLSIVICNYNYAQFLGAAIQSAVDQSHPDTEVIVVDDGSTDGSRDVIAQWAGRVTVCLEENGGQVAAYNRGFERSRGEVVIFLDSDDLLDRDLGKHLVDCFADPSVVKVHYRLRLVDAEGVALGGVIPRRLADGDVTEMLRERGLLYDSSPGSGNAYRRSALARLMPLPISEVDRHGADFFALMGVALLGRVYALGPEPHASYRVHKQDVRLRMYFGNAGLAEPAKTIGRYHRLASWLVDRLGPDYELPPSFSDFSTEKLVFASIVFDEDYLHGLVGGLKFFATKLGRSIWDRPTSWLERVGLVGWALSVVVLPRRVGKPIARYVCNPASRA